MSDSRFATQSLAPISETSFVFPVSDAPYNNRIAHCPMPRQGITSKQKNSRVKSRGILALVQLVSKNDDFPGRLDTWLAILVVR